MKAVLISIQPKHCGNITLGIKKVEVRKTKPKIETRFKCYIYETQGRTETPFVDEDGHEIFKGRGQVIGEFVCDKFYDIIQYGFGAKVFTDNLETEVEPSEFIKMSCLSEEQIFDYIGNKDGYAWHISDLVIYDKPKELREFKPYNRTEDDCNFSNLGYAIPKCEDCHECYVKRPPQSWCYVEELR